jgi:hypothetical protein
MIGRIIGDEFVKEVDGTKHMLRKPPAWAVDMEAWINIRHRIGRIRVIDHADGKEYVLTVWEFEIYKWSLSRGHRYQYYVTLDHWRGPDDPEPKERVEQGTLLAEYMRGENE